MIECTNFFTEQGRIARRLLLISFEHNQRSVIHRDHIGGITSTLVLLIASLSGSQKAIFVAQRLVINPWYDLAWITLQSKHTCFSSIICSLFHPHGRHFRSHTQTPVRDLKLNCIWYRQARVTGKRKKGDGGGNLSNCTPMATRMRGKRKTNNTKKKKKYRWRQ